MTGTEARGPRCAGGDAGSEGRRRRFPPGNPVPRAERRRLPAVLRSWVIPLLTLICLAGLPMSGAAGAAATGAPKPTARDKCPVCGMFVAKYPDWLAAIRFQDGRHAFFDGAKDMFKYLQDMKRYDPGRKPEDIRAMLVMDYYDLSWIDARKAWYVIGSDVYGPMGRELIPLEKEADAKEFMKDHKGLKIIRFQDVTKEVVKALD